MTRTIILNHRSFSEKLKNLESDLRVSARRIVRNVAEEMVEESVLRVSRHYKTGNMEMNIVSYPLNGWTRVVDFGDARFLDSGSLPHKIPWDVAKEMAPKYDMTPGQFYGMIKHYGTAPHPFINDTYEKVLNRIDVIIQKELDRVIK